MSIGVFACPPGCCSGNNMLTGNHQWSGFAPFHFPGIVGTWTEIGQPPYNTGSWNGGSTPAVAVGQIILYYQSAYQDGFGDNWPAYSVYYICISPVTAGSTPINPGSDTAHFVVFDFTATWAAPLGSSQEGPSYYPLMGDAATPPNPQIDSRQLWGAGTAGGKAYLTITIVDDLTSFPAAGTNVGPNGPSPGPGKFTRTWKVNRWTGALTMTSSGGTPTSAQLAWMWPNIGGGALNFFGINVTQYQVAFNLCSGFQIGVNGNNPAYTQTLTLDLTSEYCVNITTGSPNAQKDTLTLIQGNLAGNTGLTPAASAAAQFAALGSYNLGTCTYNADSTINVAVTSLITFNPPRDFTYITESCCPNSGGIFGSGPCPPNSGYAQAQATWPYGFIGFNAVETALNGPIAWYMSIADIELSSESCVRSFHCSAATPYVGCTTYNAGGTLLLQPTLPAGETAVWQYLFINCSCT